MSRIQKYYERRFARLASRQPTVENGSIFERVERVTREQSIPAVFAMALVHADLRHIAGETKAHPAQFLCDAGLGGLARWLCAFGYEANWNPALDDAAVIREAMRRRATLITTDSLMMERGVLRDGFVPSVFVPSSLTCEDQLVIVLREMNLPMRESRCMRCGGELRRVDKAEVLPRIPPKTALWLDEYFVCARCDQLFWRGTHWRQITEKLQRLADH